MLKSVVAYRALPYRGLVVAGSSILVVRADSVVAKIRVPSTISLSVVGTSLVVVGPKSCIGSVAAQITQHRLRLQRLFESRGIKIHGRMQNFLNGNLSLWRLFKINNEFAMPLVVGLWPSRLRFSKKKFAVLVRTGRGTCASVFTNLLVRLVRFNVFTNKGISLGTRILGRVKLSKKTKQKR